MSYIIAVDSGGTFCDCVAFDGNGKVTRAKASSTPPNFDQGVLDAVTEVAKRIGRPLTRTPGEGASACAESSMNARLRRPRAAC